MSQTQKMFSADMTVGEALKMHPQVQEILMTFHIGGCAHCAINEVETLGQVSEGYGVDTEALLEALNDLLA
jgi:hybrid cluster-associated redox disulfide protein